MMSSLSLSLLLLLLTSLCDSVSGYRVSRRTEDITTFEDQETSGLDDDSSEDDTSYSGSGSGYSDIETEFRSTTDSGWVVTSLPSASVYTFALGQAAKEGEREREGEQSMAGMGTSAPTGFPTGFATALVATSRPATVPAATPGWRQDPTSGIAVVTEDLVASAVPVTTTGTAIATTRSPPDATGTARASVTSAPQTTSVTQETSPSTDSSSSKTLMFIPSTTQEEELRDVAVEPTVTNEVEAPAGGAPSGDFAFSDNSEANDNEVVAVASRPTDRAGGVDALPGAIDNAIDTDISSSAAQLPQKNILERKEVLIAVIVGGVVGALFAAFLVMLLIYRMKKKDEGSYTLEEPKQASIAYQKPDTQEEFYA